MKLKSGTGSIKNKKIFHYLYLIAIISVHIFVAVVSQILLSSHTVLYYIKYKRTNLLW